MSCVEPMLNYTILKDHCINNRRIDSQLPRYFHRTCFVFTFNVCLCYYYFLPARRYASAGTVSVCHKSVFYRNG